MDDEGTEGGSRAGQKATRTQVPTKVGTQRARRKANWRSEIPSKPLKSIPVVYRGLVRARGEAERDRRMRHDLEQSLSRLPTYIDDEEDPDDKQALGKSAMVYTRQMT